MVEVCCAAVAAMAEVRCAVAAVFFQKQMGLQHPIRIIVAWGAKSNKKESKRYFLAESKPFWSYWQKTALLWVPQHDPAMAATTFFYHGRHSTPLLWPPQQASAMVACPAMAAIACLCHYSTIAPQYAFTMGATAHLCHGRHSTPSPWLPQHASAMAAMARLCHDRHSTPLSWPPWHASAMTAVG
jgi:hypothetical protein